jgi:hypothetical protein
MVSDKLVGIVSAYLDPMVEGMESDHEAWMLANITPAMVVHLLALILCVDQLLQKKTRSALTLIFRMETPQVSSSDLPTRPERPSTKSWAGPASAHSFS